MQRFQTEYFSKSRSLLPWSQLALSCRTSAASAVPFILYGRRLILVGEVVMPRPPDARVRLMQWGSLVVLRRFG